jgi:prevent-host-death family protein
MTQTIKTTDVGGAMSDIIKKVSQQEARVVVEENGKPVAAIISAQDLQRFSQLEAQRRERFKVVEEIQARNRDKDPEEVERVVAEEVEAMRQERRERRTPKPQT